MEENKNVEAFEGTEEVKAEAVVAENAEAAKEAPVAEAFDIGQSDNKSGKGMGWYVVHTYSGYENKVKANIEKAIENRHLENEILEVRVPMQDVVEVKNNAKRTVSKKLFPGYVLIHMDADNNDAWYVVRNTRGVTGFVGPGSKPIPLTDAEIENLGVAKRSTAPSVKVGDIVNIVAGALNGFEGTVKEIDEAAGTVLVTVSMFGRETPTTLELAAVEKIGV